MITMVTQGRLGNQMFQYAAGLNQSIRLGTELVLDTAKNPNHGMMPFNLSLFDLPVKAEAVYGNVPTYLEHGVNYDESINEVKDGDVLSGYFQSEKYFSKIASLVRRHLSPMISAQKRPWSREALDFFGKLHAAQERSTMIGFRRGDYLKKLNYHGIMPDEYYSEALNVVASHLGMPPVLFIFSDEPQWVADNMEFPYETHVFTDSVMTQPGRVGQEDVDLAMMSYCNNAIIPNSSFHWWGAWLREPYRNGVTVAPATWFTDPTAQAHAFDIVPDRWTKI